jgi:2-polyprenyl-6-methoxyphenol hydroxylase-like FAD-dependent oxidoreductase
MRNIAIVGAGQAGLLAAHALLKDGYRVTLFSDKTPNDFLNNSHPTGTALRFDMALEYERELGLNFWDADVPWINYAHVTLAEEPDNRVMTLCGRFEKTPCAIDLRLQSARWLKELEQRGGKVIFEKVDLKRLDEIAVDHELTIVAAGHGEIQDLFKRDDLRSTQTHPQRQVAMACVKGPAMNFEQAPKQAVKFNLFPKYGECLWIPWLHKDLQQTWSLLVEAKEGGPFDGFRNAKNGTHVLDIMLQQIRKMIPWDYEWVKDAELADEHSWQKGAITQTVRNPVGTLPSGRHVLAVGDTAISLDPIAGQGANNGNKMVRNLVRCIREREDRAFDKNWMEFTFEEFWERHHWVTRFTDMLLAPMSEAGRELFIAQYGSTGRPEDNSPQQKLADLMANNFNDPAMYTLAFEDLNSARKLIRETTGSHWALSKMRGMLLLGLGQFKQKLKMDPHHPSSAPFMYRAVGA